MVDPKAIRFITVRIDCAAIHGSTVLPDAPATTALLLAATPTESLPYVLMVPPLKVVDKVLTVSLRAYCAV